MFIFSAISDFFTNHWLLLSFCAPALWALVNIIDVYFVKEIYTDEWDGTIISGLFQIIPWCFFITFVNFGDSFSLLFSSPGSFAPDRLVWFAIVGGFLFVASFFFYFKALFKNIDVALAQIIWSLPIVFVPLISYVIGTEVLGWNKYVGIAVTLLGLIVLSLSGYIRQNINIKYLFVMMMAVIIFSLSMIFEDAAYTRIDSLGYGNDGFWFVFAMFSLGAVLAGVFFAMIKKRNPWSLIKKYWKVFVLAEGISFIGTLTSQRSIDIAPAVSYVATTETFVPVFVMVFSGIIVLWLFLFRKKLSLAREIYSEQIKGFWIKLLSTLIMALGVYIIK